MTAARIFVVDDGVPITGDAPIAGTSAALYQPAFMVGSCSPKLPR